MKIRLFKRMVSLITALLLLCSAVPISITAEEISVLDEDKFTILWTSDPQWYSFAYPEIIAFQNQWVVDNYDRMDMRYILYTGDFVDNPHSESQWSIMNDAYALWDEAGLAYGVLAGNHDVDGSDHTEFSQYFGKARYENNPWYGGDYDDNFGHYDLMTIEGVDFLFVYLGYNSSYTEEDIAWLNSVLAAYPTRIAMLSFHDYLTASGRRSTNGERFFQEVVLKNPNVRAVYCGHNYNSARKVDNIDDDGDGEIDRTVYQMMANYQSTTNGGNGFMRFMEFDLADGTVTHRTYSPYIGEFGSDYEDGTVLDEYGTRDSFTIPFDFSAPTAKGADDPEQGTVIVTRELTVAQTDTASAMVIPIAYQNVAESGDAFNGLGIYDRFFSLNAADAFSDPRSLNYIVAAYSQTDGYTVTSVIEGSSLSAEDPFVAIPQDGIVVAMSADVKTKNKTAVDLSTITVGRKLMLKNATDITTPSVIKSTSLCAPWGNAYSITGINRMSGNDDWVLYDSANAVYDHTWDMLFAFTPVSGQSGEYTLTSALTTLGTDKTLAIPENGFVLAINTYSGEDPLRSSLCEYFAVGTVVTLNDYTPGEESTYSSQSILPSSISSWSYDSSLVTVSESDGAQVLYKVSGDWPSVDYNLTAPITFDPADAALSYDFFMETSSKANILLFFNNSNTTSYTTGEYLSIQSYFSGVTISSGSGDIKGDDLDHSGKIDLSSVTFPDGCYNDDGTLTLNAVRVMVSSTAGTSIYLRDLSVTTDTRTETAPNQTIPLLDPSALSVTTAAKDGGYTYDNGELTVNAYSADGFEMAVELNKAVDVSTLKNWLIDLQATTNFDVKLEVTTAASDASYGLVSEFNPTLCAALDNKLIPAGTYQKSLDLYSCYTWNKVAPDDGISTIKRVVIKLGGEGSLTIRALQLSNTEVAGAFADGVYTTIRTMLDSILTASVGTTVSTLLGNLSVNGTATVYDENGDVTTGGVLKTNMRVVLTVGDVTVDEAVVAVLGDVNANGTHDASDARYVLMHVLGTQSFSEAQTTAADYNCDKAINTSDVRAILRAVVS